MKKRFYAFIARMTRGLRAEAVADHAFPWHNGLGALSRSFM